MISTTRRDLRLWPPAVYFQLGARCHRGSIAHVELP